MLERDLERKLKKRIELECRGAMCLKFVSPGCIGVPDRVILLPQGKAVFVEMKKPKGLPSARQKYIHEILKGLNFPVFSSVDSDAYVDAVIRYCKYLCDIKSGDDYGV